MFGGDSENIFFLGVLRSPFINNFVRLSPFVTRLSHVLGEFSSLKLKTGCKTIDGFRPLCLECDHVISFLNI